MRSSHEIPILRLVIAVVDIIARHVGHVVIVIGVDNLCTLLDIVRDDDGFEELFSRKKVPDATPFVRRMPCPRPELDMSLSRG